MKHIKMLSFHSTESVKRDFLRRISDLQTSGETSNYHWYETELGIPRILTRLAEQIVEGLPHTDAQICRWTFFTAIPVGKDLTPVWKNFLIWLLIDEAEGVLRHSSKDDQQMDIKHIAHLIRCSMEEKTGEAEFLTYADAYEAADIAADAAVNVAASAALEKEAARKSSAYAAAAYADIYSTYAFDAATNISAGSAAVETAAESAAAAVIHAIHAVVHADAAIADNAPAKNKKYRVMYSKLIDLLHTA